VPDNVTDVARDVILFLGGLGLEQVDLLGFSLGGHIAQELALLRPRMERGIVLAGTEPQGGPDLHRWTADVYAHACADEITTEHALHVFFSGSEESRAKGME
jgi:pimeloyl-ACP methyl ester carboxylesterase